MSGKPKAGFARRLASLSDALQLPSGRGRTAALARMFRVTPNAAKKWLEGDGMPELDKAIEIANRANVDVRWLLQGTTAHTSEEPAAVVSEVLFSLADDVVAEVADFVRYKIERSGATAATASEPQARYLERLDEIIKAQGRKT